MQSCKDAGASNFTRASLSILPSVLPNISQFLNRYALMFAFSIEAFILAIVVSSRIKILKLEKTKAQIDANTDVLREVLNRRGWEQNAADLLNFQWHNQGVLGLLYIDINDFKFINDTYGHVVFDSVPDSISLMLQAADKSIYSAKKENKFTSSYVLS